MSREREPRWYKHDGNSDSNPRIQKAGFWGARAYEALLRIDTDFELGGEVPPHYCDPEYLARRIMATDVLPLPQAIEAMQGGLEKLCIDDPKWALLERTDDGGVVILGRRKPRGEEGDDRPLTSTERSRNRRARLALEAQVEALEAKIEAMQRDATEVTDATLHKDGNVAGRKPVAATLPSQEERRGEEKRRDPDPPRSPPASAEGAPPGKAGKRKPRRRDLSEAAETVRAEIAKLTSVEYPPAAFDALEARLSAKELSLEDALAMVRWAAREDFWGGEVKLAPSTLFRPRWWPEVLAKAQAAPRPKPPGAERYHRMRPEDDDVYARLA